MNEREINNQYKDPTASEVLGRLVGRDFDDRHISNILSFVERYELRKLHRLEKKRRSKNLKGGVQLERNRYRN